MSKLAFVVLFSVFLAACGSEIVGIPERIEPGTGTPPSGATAGIANGTCALTLVDGATKIRWEGTARVSMNGSGNLRVQCLPKDGGDSRVELGFGNGSFDGPRTYLGDETTADGTVTYDPNDSASGIYDSHTKGASCRLVLGEAELDTWKTSVPRGKRIAGTFSCAAIVDTSKNASPAEYAVEDGQVAGIVEP